MGLEMSPGAVVSKLDAMNVSLNQTIDHAQKMIYKITELENTRDQLVGESYDCIRNHFADMHIAVVKSIILYAEAMIQENNAYKGYINGYLGGIGYVDEDKLKEDKFALKEQINQAYGLMIATKCGTYSSWISSMEYALRLVEDKLDLIDDFKAAAGGVYRSIDLYKTVLRNGIESLHSAVFDGKTISYPVDYINRGWKREVESKWSQREQRRIETIKEPFVQNMEMHFGFDKNTAEIMYKLYEEMDMQGIENINQEYFSLFASIIYPYGVESRNEHNSMWKYLAGTGTEEETKQKLRNYGLNDTEIECLYGSVEANHAYSCLDEAGLRSLANEDRSADIEDLVEANKKYFYKVDMGHMSVILSTILNPDDTSIEKLGVASGVFNGIFDLNANAGYVGDVYGTAGNGPKLTPDDYQADLDAVNLSTRLGSGENAVEVMNEYYAGLNNGKINRAKEFMINLGNGDQKRGKELLREQVWQNLGYDFGKNIKKEEIRTMNLGVLAFPFIIEDGKIERERAKVVYNFIHSVETESNQYIEFLEVDEQYAEQGKRDKRE